jgi:hypothetical protein
MSLKKERAVIPGDGDASYRSPSVGGLIKMMNTFFYITAASNPPTKIFLP